jgi:hypothetical protein
MSFIPKQWVGEAGTPDRGKVDAMEQETLLAPRRIGEEEPIRTDGA